MMVDASGPFGLEQTKMQEGEGAAPVMPASPGTLAVAVLLMTALPQPRRSTHLQPAIQAQLAS